MAAGDHEQEKVQASLGRDPPSKGSNRIVSLDDEKASPTYGVKHEEEQQGKGWRQCLGYIGPGFLVAMAYLDPGNLETDLQAGSNHKYELLWIVLVGLVFALIIQSLAANLGVTTGKHLAEHCKAEYPKYVSFCLWVLAEVAVIAADIPEVIGTAFALNLLFRLPVWAGVLLTGLSTLVLLGVQRFGVRKLELLIAVLVFLMAGCFFGELAIVKPNPSEVLRGLFVPSLRTDGAVPDAIALLGALIMPHNLFLHSALVLSRKVSPTRHGIKRARRYFLLESGFALLVALLINIAIVSVTGSVCSSNTLSANDKDKCDDLSLDSASFLLKNVLGGSSSTIYAIALLASGQSSTITGTYSGQFIMQGFLNLKMKKWLRNLFTRCIAIVPSLLVALIGGSAAAGQLIIITSMILSFELPFAMIPLLKFSSSKVKLGPHKNSSIVIIIAWILGLLIIGINVYYLITAFMGWLLHNELPKYGSILVGLVVFPLMALYLASVVYLTLRKDKVLTFVEECKADQDQHQIENGLGCEMHMNTKREEDDQAVVPYREDLADIPFPE